MSEKKKTNVLNAVDGFEAATCTLGGEVPLDVKKLWFRLAYPTGRMVSKVIQLNDKLAIMEARLYLTVEGSDDSYLANGLGMAKRDQTDTSGQYIHQAEDDALDRALYNAGFGIQYSVETTDAKAPRRMAMKKAEKEETAETVSEDQTSLKEASAEEAEEAAAESPKENTPAEPAPIVTETDPAKTVTSVTAENDGTSLERLLSSMTLREAVAVIVDVGAAKGKTIGQIAKEDPKQLIWFRDSYKGPNNHIRAAATLLLREAGDTSSDVPETLAA